MGIIGTGKWGRKLVEEFNGIQNVTISGISDLSDENLAFCTDRYGVTNTYKEYRDLLALSDMKAVAIATPNSTHYEICKAALEAGKHVIIEKPITLDSKQAWELVKLAEKKNLALSVGHIFRFNNALAEAKRLIGQRFMGRLFLLDLTWVNKEKLFDDRDVIVDLSPHMFDIMNYLLDEWPVEITATASSHRSDVLETAYIHARFPSGILANINISWVVPKKTRQVSIIGESRSMLINAVAQEVTVFESGYTYNLGIMRNNTIRDELLHFIESIGNPLTETKNSGVIGAKTIELIESTNRSLEEKRSILL